VSVLAPDEATRPTESPASAEGPPLSEAELAERQLLGKPMPADRLRGWLVAGFFALVGGFIRLQNLGHPTDKGAPVFDEKHYAPQAWEMLRNGGYEDNPAYELTVHPPLSKQLIAAGEWLFGYNGWGWRFTAALAGALMILLIVRIARRLTRSTLLGAVVVESVYALPGLGSLLATGIAQHDYPVIQGVLFVSTLAVLVIGFLADLVQRFIDPRLRGRLSGGAR